MGIKTIELNEMQASMIMSGILRLKENEFFKDGIADEYLSLYTENVALRAVTSDAKQKLFPGFYKLKISENKLQYLIRLTEMNPLDEQELSEYIKTLEEQENKISSIVPKM